MDEGHELVPLSPSPHPLLSGSKIIASAPPGRMREGENYFPILKTLAVMIEKEIV